MRSAKKVAKKLKKAKKVRLTPVSLHDITRRLMAVGQIRRPLTPDNDNQPLSSITVFDYAARLEAQNGRPYSVDGGSRYWRVLEHHSPGSRSVVVFVDKVTGQVYRADSAKKRGRPLGFKLRGTG